MQQVIKTVESENEKENNGNRSNQPNDLIKFCPQKQEKPNNRKSLSRIRVKVQNENIR